MLGNVWGLCSDIWAEDVESRFDAYDRGEIQALSVEGVFARINQR
jgi:hypothetical protein